MKRKWWLTAAMAAVMAAALAGCGSKAGQETVPAGSEGTTQAAESSSESGNAAAQGTLTVAIWDKNQEPGPDRDHEGFYKGNGN